MMTGQKKIGRPSSTETEEREKLTLVSFKVDAETLAAITQLEEAIGGGHVRGKRSLAIRKAVLEARERLSRSISKR